MNGIDIILVLIIAGAVLLAVRSRIRARKNGTGCCGDCSRCGKGSSCGR